MMQMAILLTLLAGDTAQCISKDSFFRFPEIKAAFFEHYDSVATETGQPKLAKPTQFSLAKNYRSHQGILSLASFTMQMLWNGQCLHSNTTMLTILTFSRVSRRN